VASASCRRGPISRAIKPRSKTPCRWRNVGSWRRFGITSSFLSKNSTRPSASYSHRPFRKKDGTRASVWEAIDRPALKPLPIEPFDLSQWSRARVNIDYHVSFDANLYSVPYNLVHELVEIRSTPTTVEILHKGTRVASHQRSRARGQAVTNEEHRPKSHRAHLEWTPSRMVHWAETIGPHTARLFERIMNDKPHPEMGYRGCLGIIRLAEKVLRASRGSRRRTSAAHRRVPVQER
jgi:hypothetical protein